MMRPAAAAVCVSCVRPVRSLYGGDAIFDLRPGPPYAPYVKEDILDNAGLVPSKTLTLTRTLHTGTLPLIPAYLRGHGRARALPWSPGHGKSLRLQLNYLGRPSSMDR